MSETVGDRRPPDAVGRLLNPCVRILVRSPFGRLVEGLAVLEFKGRQTHRRYRVVTGWHHLDGGDIVLTPARWRANFLEGEMVTVTHRGHRMHRIGHLDTEPATVATAINQLLDTGTKPGAMGMKLTSGHRLTPDDVLTLNRALIRFSEPGSMT